MGVELEVEFEIPIDFVERYGNTMQKLDLKN